MSDHKPSQAVRELREAMDRYRISGGWELDKKVEAVIAELEAANKRVSDEFIRGRLTRLERAHNKLLASWELETGKPWIYTDDE